MIRTRNLSTDYLTEYTDGTHTGESDAPASKGGGDAAFTPFGLLEASLAACLNITLRVYAKNHDIPLDGVTTEVSLVTGPDGSIFEYSADLPDTLDENQKKRLVAAMKGCPIHAILSKPVAFEYKEK